MYSVLDVIKVVGAIQPESSSGLIPLAFGLMVAPVVLAGVSWYGWNRVRTSEGLGPVRVELPYAGPPLSWNPGAEPTRKLVVHDTLGLGEDLAWNHNRKVVPTSLAPQTSAYSSEPIVAMELAAKVFDSNLSLRAGSAKPEEPATQPSRAERIAALRNAGPLPQHRLAMSSPAGTPKRTDVLRAADYASASAPVFTAETTLPVAKSPLLTKPATSTATAALAASIVAPKMTNPIAAAKACEAMRSSFEGKVTEYSFADFAAGCADPASPPSNSQQNRND